MAFDTELGVMGMASHPIFVKNGRFFLSFNRDKMRQPGCSGRRACNTGVDCIGAYNGVCICQHHTIISEFTANDTTSKPLLLNSI